MTETLKKHASLRGTSNINENSNVAYARGLNSHNALSPYQPNALSPCGHAFTMAEILLSLTIIGVVAAITLPSLMANINERTWNTQRKALYARMSQAIAMLPQLNGYGTLTEDTDGVVTEDTVAEAFITEGLSKVLKINNICDNEHLADCGVPTQMSVFGGSLLDTPLTLAGLNPKNVSFSFNDGINVGSFSLIDTKAVAFETQNGESVLAFYNPFCQERYEGISKFYPASVMCANFVFDLNGNKGPNTVGKDIGFMTANYPYDSVVVAPNPQDKPLAENYSWVNAGAACTNFNPEYRLPNILELSSISVNASLTNISEGYYWSSDKATATRPWYLWSGGWANSWIDSDGDPRSVWCVKR